MLRLFRKQRRPTPDLPTAFGYNCQWLAFLTNDPQAVVTALQLRRVVPANWESGIRDAYANKVFVSPALEQWVLAVGTTLPDAGDAHHPDRMIPLLTKLSLSFIEVQYFGTHRVVEYHAWAKARQGKIIRAYAYLGETGMTLWNQGDRTAEEIELGLIFADPTSSDVQDGLRFPDEADVLAVARRWSIDTTFVNGPYAPGIGVLGVLK